MQIKIAKLVHAKDLHRIHTDAVNKVCKNFYIEKQIKAWLKGRSPEGYKGIEKGEMYIAEEDGKIVGFGHAVPGEILAIFVDPTFHKKGVGKLLLKHGLKMALINHQKVKVESALNAEGFYEKHGFIKIKNGICTRNGAEIPIVIMEYSTK